MTVERINDNADNARVKRSLSVVLLTMFLSSLGFTIFIPILWFYYRTFKECQCPEGQDDCDPLEKCYVFQGWIVGAFPLGQFIMSPIYGTWSSKRNLREVIIFSLLVSAGSYLWFSNVSSGWEMLASRFALGIGGANVAVLRAYASYATSGEQRTGIMAKMSAAQSIGFVLGPGVGYLFGLLHGWTIGPWVVNQYTSAGYAAALIMLINAVLFTIYFFEIDFRSKAQESSKDPSYFQYDKLAVGVLVFFFSTCVFVFSVYEGAGTQMTERFFGWHVKQNGIFLASLGVLSIIAFVGMKPAANAIGERPLMVVGMLITFLSFVVLVDWGWPKREIPMWQYVISSVTLVLGYPVAQAMSYVRFSKITPILSQGVMMGWLTSGGSLARMLGPPWASFAFTYVNYHTYFLAFSAMGVVALAMAGLMATYGRMQPHTDHIGAVRVADEDEYSDSERLLGVASQASLQGTPER